MKNIRQFTLGVIFSLTILISFSLFKNKLEQITSIDTNNSEAHIDASQRYDSLNKNDIEFVIAKHLMSIKTETLEQLIETSELGVNGIITDSTNYIYTDSAGIKTPYTKLTLLVDHVYSGDTDLLNSEITILEFGGIISKEDLGIKQKFPNLSNLEAKSKVNVLSEGLPHTKKNQEIAAFLYEEIEMNTGFKFYQFTSDYRSKFYLDYDTDEYERPVPDDIQPDTKKEDLLNEEITLIVENSMDEEEIIEELIE